MKLQTHMFVYMNENNTQFAWKKLSPAITTRTRSEEDPLHILAFRYRPTHTCMHILKT
jgi:hypothetical protein